MLQVSQNLRDGTLRIATVPAPLVKPGHVLIANAASVISAGTERSVVETAKSSLLSKARQRPDQVRKVLEKMKQEGVFKTLSQVFDKLEEPIALGYASAGVVLATGPGVQGLPPGTRVASNGPHAGVVCVPKHLCAAVPESVPLESAAYAVLGAIALNGIRLAKLGLGDAALVVGLGLVGQITVALLKASGCRVLGTDPEEWKCELARRMGANQVWANPTAAEVIQSSGGLGADAVLITASTSSDAPVRLAADAVRQKGRIVVVGAVGLNLERRPLYFKEAELVISCSYGPGRYDPDYEEQGREYPAGHVKWTEQRNLQAVLDMMATGRLDVGPLTTHRFPVDRAEEAYALIQKTGEKYLGILLQYPDSSEAAPSRSVPVNAPRHSDRPGFSALGAGAFARAVLLPALSKTPEARMRILCAAGGLSSSHSAEKFGFEVSTTDEDRVFDDPETSAILSLTRHDLHAAHVQKALRSGKHVFVEKPLALTTEEVDAIDALVRGRDRLVMVGFNRRFSPAAAEIRRFFSEVVQPLTVSIRMNAGAVAENHWTQSEEVGGGRIIGEACHAIDLASFLAGSRPVRVYAEAISGPEAPSISDDQCFITLRHANGSVSSVAYVAGGDRALPKERVEVFGGGRIGIIDDFREVTTVHHGKSRVTRIGKQDKGHREEVAAFVRAVKGGGPGPIAWDDLRAVSLASILAVRSLREGLPFDIP